MTSKRPTSNDGIPTSTGMNRGVSSLRAFALGLVVLGGFAGGVLGFRTSDRCFEPHRRTTTVVECLVARQRIPPGTVVAIADFSTYDLTVVDLLPPDPPGLKNERVQIRVSRLWDDPGFLATAGLATRTQLEHSPRTLEIEIAEGEVLRERHLGIGTWVR